MKPDLTPMSIALVALIEFVFGIGYNALVAFAHDHKLMHVSLSVAIGVAVTLLVPAAAWFDVAMPFWQAGILLALCFAASGVPMIVGSTRRHVLRKDDKKRRPWPNAALKVRDDAVMELSAIAHDIAEKSKTGRLSLNDLPDTVHRLHGVIGILKSV